MNEQERTQENFPNSPYLKFYKENKKLITKSTIIFVVFLFFYVLFVKAPSDFPVSKIINIEKGMSLNSIVLQLEKEEIIRSPFLFKTFAYLTWNQKSIYSGDYFFKKESGLFSVFSRLSTGEYGLMTTDVVIPEGSTIREIAGILKSNFKSFNEEFFLKLSSGKEGYLFPDTYKFLPNVGPREVIATMEENFNKKIEEFLPEIEAQGKTLHDIVVMASIIEEEVRTQETRHIVSGILWTRIDIGMPLQVDAVFPYIIGKNTFELTLEDLQIDSPYNTYKHKGLPPGAISNPGISSIEAAVRPLKTSYLFYLSDRNGNMHYSENFEGHKRNKEIYLK